MFRDTPVIAGGPDNRYTGSVRRLLLTLSLPLLTMLPSACEDDQEQATSPAPPPYPDPIALASPFVGSGGFGFHFGSAFAGALFPQGLVKLGPDTKGPWGDFNSPLALFLHYSGYWYGDDTIVAFSHLHLHGTGATDYGVLGFMPLDGFDAGRIPPAGHQSPFRKETERASPGRYQVTLDNGAIEVDLTASAHVGRHRYRFPREATPFVLVDLTHHLSGGSIPFAEAWAKDGVIRGKFRHQGGMSRGFGGYD
ncbi:MAG: hypothetical protein RMJ98_21375 [Myxococcales bacterium]|nr:hypothetical protein [Polyangiaceae bacterium]MDW8251856.1 hypothetical protein [Myxococcales bacterium]